MRFEVVENKNYVAYIAKPAKKHNGNNHEFNQYVEKQEQIVKHIVETKNGTLLETFIELGDNRRSRHPWPELEAAITYAIEHEANLLIDEVHHYLANKAFTKQIAHYLEHASSTGLQIYCCDQTYITKDNFQAIVAHTTQQRKHHGLLIKEGLHRSQSKSGNPNAMSVINQVNKPKIDNAIMFSLVLSPVISAYQLQGLSQRKMVTRLNDEGFHAPEGGQWVLSQLQKVLNRIKVNEASLSLEHHCQKHRAKGLSSEQIAIEFNKLGIPSPFKDSWTQDHVETIEQRIQLIHEILELHDFILMLSPILEKYHIDELNEEVFISEFEHAGIKMPQNWAQGA